MANKYFRQFETPPAATETTMYTVPEANTAIVNSLRITNADSGSTLLDVRLKPDGGATAYSLLSNHFLPVNSTMDVFSGISCVMQADDVLTIESSQADVDFYLSYLEIDRN
ncbi:MAG TPA: hypothetical protein VKP88_00270 [Candidatus Paceibacterota bacterium]|nr:hypothetical protein [Candidatus Paceibacterota bacterium]